MLKFKTLTSKYAVLSNTDIDTDQIIPAQFLKITTKEGLGKHVFSAWRYLPNGDVNTSFVLNQAEYAETQVIVAGDNFGCGSSREHAPWALVDFGIRAVISTSFADIFSNNALKNGLLPIKVSRDVLDALMCTPGAQVVVDLEAQHIQYNGQTIAFRIEPFARYRLLHGIDELDYLISQKDAIATYEQQRGK